jgi:hypothetical protein
LQAQTKNPPAKSKQRDLLSKLTPTVVMSILALLSVLTAQYFTEYVWHESSRGSSHGSANTSSMVPVLHNYHCTNTYSIEMLSFDPVIMYLNGFITDLEIDYLLGK